MTDATRTPTPIDTIADAWVDTLAELEPSLATYIGRFEFNDRFGDYSPAGHGAPRRRGAQDARRARPPPTPVDDIDAVTKLDLTRELELELELHDAQVASARPERHRLARAGHPVGVRPHAHRHRRRLVGRSRRA